MSLYAQRQGRREITPAQWQHTEAPAKKGNKTTEAEQVKMTQLQSKTVRLPNRYINRFSEKAYVKTKVMSRASPHKCPSFDLTDDVFIKPAPPESPGVQQPGLLSPALRLFDIPCQEDNQNSKHLKEREASPLQEASTVNGGQNDVQKQSPSALKKETQAAGKAGKRVSLQDKYEFTGDDPVVGEACNSSEKPVVAKGPRQKCSKKRKKEVGTASSPAAPGNKRRKTGKQSKTSNDLGCKERQPENDPLVQVARLAPCLKAAFLHSAMPPAQKEQVLSQIRDGHVHFVLVSPESLVEGSSIVHQLPPVAFACIDEAHCLSEWSHNFRPSYLQLYKVLTTQLKVHCILALTATATRSTCLNIAEQLQIDNFSAGIIGTPSVPENLILSVSEDKYRDEALIELLKSKRLGSCESIIVYCTRREETERLASLIRTSLQHQEKQVDKDGAKVKSRRAYLAWDAEAYHAGMTPFRRRSVQKKFMTGKLRVVVATVAFGMGIDKADIRAIIHYNMPKSFENYVQEAGRAGRDGLTSHCHLFLEPEKKDQSELKRHIYANSVDRHIIRKLLKKVFAPLTQCKETEGDTVSDGVLYLTVGRGSMYEIAIPIDAAVEELDLKEENILTLLCFLEFHPRKVVQLLNRVYATCTLKCYGGPQQLRSVASKNAAVAAAMALQKKGSEQESTNTLTFPVVDVAARMGWDSKLVKSDLKRLEWDNSTLSTTGHSRKTGVIVEFSDLAFHLNVSASLTEEDCDDLLDYLHERVQKQEKMDLARLTRVHEAFQSVSCGEYAGCADTASPEKSNSLKKLIEDYFEETLDIEDTHDEPALTEQCLSSLRQEIRSLVFQHRDHSFNGRAVARIFHGIGSPCFPAQVWGRVHRFWRSFLDVDFNTILNVANKELLSLR
ncbi:hypothetical protein HPB48_003661 [Haemaphysalis longicornis]|uniref:DNA 3'-5' helicase n=1 Tax=Haemaphysalis longicornis TaxID=44386 RepID=A0A9J6FFR9_HAELO|nr:hypothetical protein HPB48_003661 [Haemaphysalis longicornis]